MLHRLVLAAPVVGLFVATGLIFLAARAPRTWAAHWTQPRALLPAAGSNEYGAVRRGPGAWDLLWVNDDDQTMVLTHARTARRPTSFVVDHGDVTEPSLVRAGGYELGAWVRNRNGATDLMAVILRPGSAPRVVRWIDSPQPLEHPYLFAGPGGKVGLVFSWQRYGNFELFLMTIPLRSLRPSSPVRLTRAKYYSFYPRAVWSNSGIVTVLHLEGCCQSQWWNVALDRFTPAGRHLGPTRVLYQIEGAAQTHTLPSQWGVDLRPVGGTLWGAFADYTGIFLFKEAADGRVLEEPKLVAPTSSLASSVSLAVGQTGGYVFWEQSYDLGTYVAGQRVDQTIRAVGGNERLAYEGAAETNPRAVALSGGTDVLWQANTSGLSSHFELSTYRRSVQPNLAERLGLGLTNPWQDLAVLAVTAAGLAALTTVGNLLLVFGFAAAGLIALRLLRSIPGKWLIFAAALSAGLYLTFVAPGGPILFLVTLPSMGLPAIPFGLIAAIGALAFVGWMGIVALRRVEDLYRAGAMVVFGVYFFAFIEAIVFVQQRIGYI